MVSGLNTSTESLPLPLQQADTLPHTMGRKGAILVLLLCVIHSQTDELLLDVSSSILLAMQQLLSNRLFGSVGFRGSDYCVVWLFLGRCGHPRQGNNERIIKNSNNA